MIAVMAGLVSATVAACSNKTGGQASESPSPKGSATHPATPVSSTAASSASASATTTPTPTSTVGLAPGVTNVLVIGSDVRGSGDIRRGNSDVIVLVQLTADHKRINMVSIARDTLATMPSGRSGKINALYPMKGPKALADEVSKQLGGLPVHHTMEIGFIGFRQVVVLLQKISVLNRHASLTAGHQFVKGQLLLPLDKAGDVALSYCRERKSLPNGDLDRTERHRAALTGIMVRLAELANTDEQKLRAMLPALWRCMRQGGTITPEMAASLIPTLKQMKASDVSSVILPIKGFGMVGGASVDLVNTARASELSAALAKADLSGYIAKYGTSNATTG